MIKWTFLRSYCPDMDVVELCQQSCNCKLLCVTAVIYYFKKYTIKCFKNLSEEYDESNGSMTVF